MRVQCECGHELEVWESLIGQPMRCTECQRSIIVRADGGVNVAQASRARSSSGASFATQNKPDSIAIDPNRSEIRETLSWIVENPGAFLGSILGYCIIGTLCGIVALSFDFKLGKWHPDEFFRWKVLFAVGFFGPAMSFALCAFLWSTGKIGQTIVKIGVPAAIVTVLAIYPNIIAMVFLGSLMVIVFKVIIPGSIVLSFDALFTGINYCYEKVFGKIDR